MDDAPVTQTPPVAPACEPEDDNPPRPKLSAAQKASRKLGKAAADEKAGLFAEDINQFLRERNDKIEALAAKHHRTVAYVKKRVDNSTHYVKMCAPNLANAIAHFKAIKVNEDLPKGAKRKLKELKELVASDPELNDLSQQQKDDLIASLVKYRESKKSGARPSNRAAAQDARATIKHIEDKLTLLREPTGALSFLFTTREHVNNYVQPSLFGSDDTLDFFPQVLQVDQWDVIRQFEQWACNPRGGKDRDTLATVCAECTKLIGSGLQFAARMKKISMNYIKYDTVIVLAHKVKLVGWPTTLKFANPSEFGVLDDVRTLRNALKTGACKWICLTHREFSKHQEDLDRRVENGEVVPRKRKTQKDKGAKRLPKASPQDIQHPLSHSDSDGDDNTECNSSDRAPSRKKAKPKKSMPACKTTAGKQTQGKVKPAAQCDDDEESNSSNEAPAPPRKMAKLKKPVPACRTTAGKQTQSKAKPAAQHDDDKESSSGKDEPPPRNMAKLKKPMPARKATAGEQTQSKVKPVAQSDDDEGSSSGEDEAPPRKMAKQKKPVRKPTAARLTRSKAKPAAQCGDEEESSSTDDDTPPRKKAMLKQSVPVPARQTRSKAKPAVQHLVSGRNAGPGKNGKLMNKVTVENSDEDDT